MKLITTKEAAEILGISTRRIQAMITAGRLPAAKIGRDYLIEESALTSVRERKPGRPAKSKNNF